MVKRKLKPILPSLREKKRYLAFEIISKKKIKDFNLVQESIWQLSSRFLGVLSLSNLGMLILDDKWNPSLQRGLIRVNNKYVNHLKAALTLINEIDKNQVIVRSVGLSGILKKAENHYLTS